MYPHISQFPSRAFYEGRITNDESVITRQLDTVLQNLANNFPRVVFFDLAGSQEEQLDLSRVNVAEANFTFQLIKLIIKNGGFRGLSSLAKIIGLVTPYKGQVRLLRTKFE